MSTSKHGRWWSDWRRSRELAAERVAHPRRFTFHPAAPDPWWRADAWRVSTDPDRTRLACGDCFEVFWCDAEGFALLDAHWELEHEDLQIRYLDDMS